MVNEIEEFLAAKRNGTYDRANFDKYAAKRKLNLITPTIHIAGSNGKSCVGLYLESIYRAAGYKVASFIVPSLGALNDSIRYDGKPIDDETLSKLFHDNKKDFEKFDLSDFEIRVALAYRYFEIKKADLAIVEAGMGGLLDATNIEDMNTVLSVITTISLEHTANLGTTPSQIALHCAGIIKVDTPVLVGRIDDESLDIIREEAKPLDARLARVENYYYGHLNLDGFHFDYGPYKDLLLKTIAEYQLRNASIAIEAVLNLREDFPVAEEALRKGLYETEIPCRVERIGRIAFDIAHNPEAAEALSRTVTSIGRGANVHVLFASLRDKNIAVELPTLANVVTDITLTTFDDPWARDETDFFLYAEDHPYVDDANGALKNLLEQYPEDVVLVTGATKFVADMKQYVLAEGLGQ